MTSTRPFTKEDMLWELDSTIQDLARQSTTEFRGRYFGQCRGILRTLSLLGIIDEAEHAELKVKIDTAHLHATEKCEAAGEPMGREMVTKEAFRRELNIAQFEATQA